MPPATAQQGVNHRATFSGFGMPNEQPVFPAKRPFRTLSRTRNWYFFSSIRFSDFQPPQTLVRLIPIEACRVPFATDPLLQIGVFRVL